jgi:hypothetical protein
MNNKLVAKVAGKKLDVLRRRNALTALDRVQLVRIKREIYASKLVMKVSLRCGLKERSARSRNCLLKLLHQHDSIALIPHNKMWYKVDKPDRKYITIDSLNDEEVYISIHIQHLGQTCYHFLVTHSRGLPLISALTQFEQLKCTFENFVFLRICFSQTREILK